jgi:DNA-binding NarL/FixJ family response regulator
MTMADYQSSESDAAVPSIIPVGVVEDGIEFRECLRILLDGTPGFRCVGTFESMEQLFERGWPTLPRVALVDIGLPGMSGIDGIRMLRGRHPDVLPIVLTIFADDDRIFAALCAGACGYLLKKTPLAQILDGIRETVAGGAPMSPEVAGRVVRTFHEVPPPADAEYRLTPYEIRLLRLLVDGHSYRSAAVELRVTSHAVSFHLRRIYDKLHVHSKTEAVATALRHRLLD